MQDLDLKFTNHQALVYTLIMAVTAPENRKREIIELAEAVASDMSVLEVIRAQKVADKILNKSTLEEAIEEMKKVCGVPDETKST